jgi:hypothetical protein
VKARDGVTEITRRDVEAVQLRPDQGVPGDRPHLPGAADHAGTQGLLPDARQAFAYATIGQVQAMAELGFIVVNIDALGNTGRSKALPRHLVRRHGRQRHPRPRRRDQAARRPAPVDRPRPASGSTATPAAASRRPARSCATPTSSRSPSPPPATTTTAPTSTTGASATRACSCATTARYSDNFESQANYLVWRQPEGQALPDAWRHGRQRAPSRTPLRWSTR